MDFLLRLNPKSSAAPFPSSSPPRPSPPPPALPVASAASLWSVPDEGPVCRKGRGNFRGIGIIVLSATALLVSRPFNAINTRRRLDEATSFVQAFLTDVVAVDAIFAVEFLRLPFPSDFTLSFSRCKPAKISAGPRLVHAAPDALSSHFGADMISSPLTSSPELYLLHFLSGVRDVFAAGIPSVSLKLSRTFKEGNGSVYDTSMTRKKI